MAGALASDRAPLLRRRALLLEQQADRATNPVKARAIARAMRVRAAELESGAQAHEFESASKLIRELGGASEEMPQVIAVDDERA
jgi:hypothetical protein